MDKLGSWISPNEVGISTRTAAFSENFSDHAVLDGSRHTHAIWTGVRYQETASRLTGTRDRVRDAKPLLSVYSLDAPLLSPGVPGLVRSVSVAL